MKLIGKTRKTRNSFFKSFYLFLKKKSSGLKMTENENPQTPQKSTSILNFFSLKSLGLSWNSNAVKPMDQPVFSLEESCKNTN